MRPQLTASPDDIDLGGAGGAVRRVLPKLLMAALAVGVACYAGLSLLTPKYASQAQIEIVSKGVSNPFEPRRDTGTPEHAFRCAWTRRRSPPTCARCCRATWPSSWQPSCSWPRSPSSTARWSSAGCSASCCDLIGLAGPRAGESDEERVLTAYYDALRVYQIKDTRGIMIEFSSEDPKLAAELANRLAELYRDDLSLRRCGEP